MRCITRRRRERGGEECGEEVFVRGEKKERRGNDSISFGLECLLRKAMKIIDTIELALTYLKQGMKIIMK